MHQQLQDHCQKLTDLGNSVIHVDQESNVITYERPNGSIGVETVNTDVTLAQQQYKDQVDVNNIMKGYDYRTLPNPQGIYADLTQVGDYQKALDLVLKAEDAFNSLDAKIRQRFENNPQNLLQFLNDPTNKNEAIQLGLIPKPAEIPQPAPASTPTTT